MISQTTVLSIDIHLNRIPKGRQCRGKCRKTRVEDGNEGQWEGIHTRQLHTKASEFIDL